MINGKIKIAFLLNNLVGGGAERVALDVLNNLDRDEFSPFLVLFSKRGEYLEFLRSDIPVFELANCNGLRNIFRFNKKLKELFFYHNPDLVITYLNSTNRTLLRLKLFTSFLPPIIVCEQNNLTRNLKRRSNFFLKKLIEWEIRILYAFTERILCCSEGIKNDLVNNFKIRRSIFSVIYNPIDLEKITSSISTPTEMERNGENEIQIVAVGRLTPQKGFYDLINMFSLLSKEVSAKLIILGEGELRTDLEKEIYKLGLELNIEMPGFVQNPWTIVKNSDVFVLSSHWEGFGNVIIEAMACETPVVSTNCDFGPEEIITDKVNGRLVPVGDISLMRDAVLEIINKKEIRNRLISGGLERVKEFDTTVVVKSYESLFKDVLI